MRDMVAVCAVLGALLEVITAVGGPQLAGVGRLTQESAPAMPTDALLVGIAGALASLVGGILVFMGRSGRRWGPVMIVAIVAAAWFVAPWTGWYTISAAFTVLAGVLALFVGRRATGSQPAR